MTPQLQGKNLDLAGLSKVIVFLFSIPFKIIDVRFRAPGADDLRLTGLSETIDGLIKFL